MSVTTAKGGPGYVSHNYIINGGFDVWQRGTSFALTGDAYTADRWNLDNRGGTITVTQEDFTPAEVSATGFGEGQFYAKIAYDASNTDGRFDSPIEDVRTLAGQTATLSFWAKSADSITLSARCIQVFGSGGSAGVTTGLSDSVTLTTSWVRYSITGTINSISGKTIGAGSYLLTRFFSTATSAEFDIWGVQLEAGSVATPFKRHAPSLQGELAACMPYFTRIESTGDNDPIANGFANSTTQVFSSINFPVPMRTTPTFSTSGVASQFEILRQGTSIIACSSLPTLSTASKLSANVVFTVASGLSAGEGVVARQDSGSFLDFSAEL